MSAILARRAGFAAAAFRRPLAATATRLLSDSYGGDTGGNITYSGGQPGVQGGFYGAGGARAAVMAQTQHRPEAVAALDDIRRLREIMQDVSEMETELGRLGTAVSSRSIELKSAIKKRLSQPTMVGLLNRLEIKEQPVWGLTQEERELVKLARSKANSC